MSPRNSHLGLAAWLADNTNELGDPVMRECFRSQEGVEHRLEHVADREGVAYINDSKATNVNATWYALECMTRPVVWIMGGTDKGNNYSDLYAVVRKKVRSIHTLSVEGVPAIRRHFHCGHHPVMPAGSMHEAVVAASIIAEPGDTVLLSPACASFDRYADYEHRGRVFKEEVDRL